MQMSIVVFTSARQMPILLIMPTYNVPGTSNAILLAFTQCGPGHYDAAQYPVHKKENAGTSDSHPKCTCGRKKGTMGLACSTSNLHHTSRCPCVKASRPCSALCRCQGCKNSLGTQSESSGPPAEKRKRLSYSNQKIPLKGKTT